MESSKNHLGAITDTVGTLETQLTFEKKNLAKIKDLLADDKEKWEKEIKLMEAKVKKTQKEVDEKELLLESRRKEFESVSKNVLNQEGENNALEKNLRAEKGKLEESRDLKNKEMAQMKVDLEDMLEQVKIQKETNEYNKRQQDIDLNLWEGVGDKKLKEKFIALSNELKRKEDELEQDLKELNSKMVSERKALWKVKDQITSAQLESDALLKKNQKLKDQIALVETYP